jgi:hypothetical protein
MMNLHDLTAYLNEVLHTDGHLHDITYTSCCVANDFGDQKDLVERTGLSIIAAIEAGLTRDRWEIKEDEACMDGIHEHLLDDDRRFVIASITKITRTPNGPKRYLLRIVMVGEYM